MNHKPGAALMIIVLLISLFFILSAFMVKMVYNYRVLAQAILQREQAFWLAEGGLEKGRVELAHNPNWYTDLPHSPEDDDGWLANQAVGQRMQLGGGALKIVREKGKDRLYSIGSKGKGIVILKKSAKWEEI